MNTGSGGTMRDIPMLPDGFADTAMQDAFCAGTICTVSLLYDHSGNGKPPPGGEEGPHRRGTPSRPWTTSSQPRTRA